MEQVETVVSVHEQITTRMCSLLRSGIIPWHTSWVTSGVPMNLITGRPYRAINAVLLAAGGYRHNQFLTERQVHKLGAFVLDGQEPHLIIDGIGFTNLRPYYVFNTEQCGGISKEIIPTQMQRNKPFEVCKEVIEHMSHCPKLLHKHGRSSYRHKADTITLLLKKSYPSTDEYFADLMKLLVWACGHESRLNWGELLRQAAVDDDAFAQVNLITQIGSWYLNNFCGLNVRPRHDSGDMSYWVEKFNCNPRLSYVASEMAQQAVEYITGIPFYLNEAIEYLEDERLPF